MRQGGTARAQGPREVEEEEERWRGAGPAGSLGGGGARGQGPRRGRQKGHGRMKTDSPPGLPGQYPVTPALFPALEPGVHPSQQPPQPLRPRASSSSVVVLPCSDLTKRRGRAGHLHGWENLL